MTGVLHVIKWSTDGPTYRSRTGSFSSLLTSSIRAWLSVRRSLQLRQIPRMRSISLLFWKLEWWMTPYTSCTTRQNPHQWDIQPILTKHGAACQCGKGDQKTTSEDSDRFFVPKVLRSAIRAEQRRLYYSRLGHYIDVGLIQKAEQGLFDNQAELCYRLA